MKKILNEWRNYLKELAEIPYKPEFTARSEEEGEGAQITRGISPEQFKELAQIVKAHETAVLDLFGVKDTVESVIQAALDQIQTDLEQYGVKAETGLTFGPDKLIPAGYILTAIGPTEGMAENADSIIAALTDVEATIKAKLQKELAGTSPRVYQNLETFLPKLEFLEGNEEEDDESMLQHFGGF